MNSVILFTGGIALAMTVSLLTISPIIISVALIAEVIAITCALK